MNTSPNYPPDNRCPYCGHPIGWNPSTVYGPIYNGDLNSLNMNFPITKTKEEEKK